MLKKIQGYMLNIYIILWFLVAYTPLSKKSLYSINFLSFIWTIVFFKNLFLYKKRINKYIFILIGAIFFSFLCNFKNLFQISYYILNINMIISIYSLIEIYQKKLLDKIYFFIVIFSILNLIIYLILPPDYIGVKIINGIKMIRVQLNLLPLSIASIISLLSFYIADKYKFWKKYLIKLLNLILIIKLGKISVLGALIFVTALSNFIFFLKLNKHMKKIVEVFIKIIIMINFSAAFIIIAIQKLYRISNFSLLTLREDIWRHYIKYFINEGNIIFGNGFIEPDNKILDMTNPHNQYLNIVIILGIVGMIAFFIYFNKILKNTLNELYFGNKVPFKIFITLIFIMISDSYFILTVFPLYMTLLMSFLLIKGKEEENGEIK